MALDKLQKAFGIRAKFIFMLAVLGGVALVGIGYGAYTFSINNSMKEADTKARIIDAYVKATRHYFMAVQRPLINELVERDRFYPEIMSGFGITRRSVDLIDAEQLRGFQFRQVSITPHHPPNKADGFEQQLIRKYQADPKKTELTGTTTRDGELYYYTSRPIKMEGEGCLKCHLDPDQAPKDLVEMYGTAGFDANYKNGDVFAAYVVYVPLAPAVAAAKEQALILFAVGGTMMLLGLLFIYVFLDQRIVKPIMELANRTEEVSVGRHLDKSLVSTKMKDEVEALARSIDRLRISLVKMLKRRKND
jgi:HAMP domain-containing protein